MKNLVSAEWLKENMHRKNLIIFDVRSILGDDNYGKNAYEKGHIPNAIFVSVEALLTGEIKEHGGRHPLPDMEEFTHNMNDLGVDDKSTVIVYDDGDLSMAGRLWWMLRYIGLEKTYILLGGFKAWESKDYLINVDKPKIRERGKLTLDLNKNMIADINDVQKAISKENEVLVDSRTPDRYRGDAEPIDKIAGHIPSAVNLPWTVLSKDDGGLDEHKIEEHYKDVADYDKIIVYCGSGITATVNILFMEEAGLSPVLYIGSYSDWISYPDNEVVTR